MSFRFRTALLALAGALCFAGSAPAQSPVPSDAPPGEVAPKPADAKRDASKPPPVAETVLVTATRSERSVSDLPVSATVISEDQIRQSPVRSVDDLLRSVPGVTPSVISSSGSTLNNQRLSMQGLGGTRALVLLDGVPIHDPYSGIVQWQTVPLDSLKQIEVVRGGNASLYGNFALGGTINLITRPVDETDVRLDLSYGSASTGRGSLTVDYLINPELSVRLSHHRLDSNGFIRVPNPGPVDIDAWTDDANTQARVDFRPADSTAAYVTAGTAKIDYSQGTPAAYDKRDISSFSAGMHHAAGVGGLFTANAYYHDQTEHLVNSTLIGARVSEFVSQDSTIPSSGGGASADWSIQRSGAIPFISIGVDMQEVKAREDRTGFNSGGATLLHELVGGRQLFAGLFAQVSWRPNDRIEVLSSGRLDLFHNENGSDAIIGGATTLYPETTSDQFDPRISVRYAMGSQSAIRASVYRAFNAPTLRDLYRNNQSGNSIILGNPNLQPETLVGGEIGGEWATGRTRLELNLFRGVIDGAQSRVIVAGTTNTFLNENLGTSRSQGVEFMGDFRIAHGWSMNAGYTFADAVVTEDPDPTLIGKEVIEVPRHYGTLTLRYRGTRGAAFEIRGQSLSRSYGDAQNTALSPAHRIVDLSISQAVRPWMDVYLLVENVFDESYYLALAATSFRLGLPRTVTAGFRVDVGPRGRN